MTRNQDGEAWGRLLEFGDPDGRKHEWACPAELLAGDGLEFRRILMDQGVDISPNSKARNLLATYVQTFKIELRAICTPSPGWHNGVFVFPDETVGQQAGERVLLQTAGEQPKMRQAGRLEEWHDKIGRLCAGNSRLVLAVSAAFAVPLLEISGSESGGINLVGHSSTGKTTALRAAASVWGGPEYLHRWRATDNGLEAVAQSHNDGLLVLDELAQVDPRNAGEIAYMLANGTGKHRAQRNGMARKPATWRLLFLSAGEIGLADHMKEAGKRARAGQEIRLIDIPADAAAGFGLFETLHGYRNGAALADQINAAVQQYHGTPIRAFLRTLTRTPSDKLKEVTETIRREFLSDLPPDADGQAQRVASRLALIAAGGEIATTFDITGWPAGEAVKAARICFSAWMTRRGGAGNQEDAAALAQVRHFIEAHGESRFSDFGDKNERVTINRVGYRRVTDSGTEYLVLPEAFKQDVCASYDYRQVAHVLRKNGMLKTEAHDRLTNKVRGIGRVYCIVEAHHES